MGGLQATSSRSISIIVYVFYLLKTVFTDYARMAATATTTRTRARKPRMPCLQFGMYVVVREQL